MLLPKSHIMENSVGDPLKRNTFNGYSRHFWSAKFPRDRQNSLVWVNRWYTPKDLRSTTPSQCHKFLAQPQPTLSNIPSHWIPIDNSISEAPPRSFSRSHEERRIQTSHPSSRCEEWSTLRQMLPSRGHCSRHLPPKWGTGHSAPPTWADRVPRRFAVINSPMTK